VFNRTPDNVHILISQIPISLPNPMLEQSSNIGLGEEIMQAVSIEVNLMQFIFVLNPFTAGVALMRHRK